MSYGFPEQEPPRRRGGGRLMFFILIGIGIFLFMNMRRPAKVPDAKSDKYSIKEGLFEPKSGHPATREGWKKDAESDKYSIKEGLFEPKDGRPEGGARTAHAIWAYSERRAVVDDRGGE